MSTIVTRSGKGSALSFTEMDANFNNLNTDKLENITGEAIGSLSDVTITSVADNELLAYDSATSEWINQTASEAGLASLTSFSVGAEGAASGDGGIAYNNTTGVFTYTPPTASGIGAIALTALSVGAEGAASGDGGLAYNNTTGVFTYTPPTAAGIGAATSAQGTLADSALQDVVDDTTPQLGGDLDVQTNKITTSTSNGNLTLEANGTGSLIINAGTGINLKAASNIFTDTATTDIDITATGLINLNSLTAFGSGIEETVYSSTTTTGTYAPDPTDGSIHYVAMTGSMTINGFSSDVAGQTITLFFDGTGGTYTLTLGASVLSPGGTLALTSGGYDIVTITCIDDVTPVYVATAVNDFQ